MAFIQLQRAADDPTATELINTDHIVAVSIEPYAPSTGNAKFRLSVSLHQKLNVYVAYATIEPAQAAYNRLSASLMPESVTIQLY